MLLCPTDPAPTLANASVTAPTMSDGKDDNHWKLEVALFIFALVVSCCVHMICVTVVVAHVQCKEICR